MERERPLRRLEAVSAAELLARELELRGRFGDGAGCDGAVGAAVTLVPEMGPRGETRGKGNRVCFNACLRHDDDDEEGEDSVLGGNGVERGIVCGISAREGAGGGGRLVSTFGPFGCVLRKLKFWEGRREEVIERDGWMQSCIRPGGWVSWTSCSASLLYLWMECA